MCGDHDLCNVAYCVIISFSKVFRYRSYMSVQRRLKLGVISVPATSIQIHALRARGSLEAFTGMDSVLLVSINRLLLSLPSSPSLPPPPPPPPSFPPSLPGNTKLISLSAVVKLAADGNLQIPGNVIQLCRKYAKVQY